MASSDVPPASAAAVDVLDRQSANGAAALREPPAAPSRCVAAARKRVAPQCLAEMLGAGMSAPLTQAERRSTRAGGETSGRPPRLYMAKARRREDGPQWCARGCAFHAARGAATASPRCSLTASTALSLAWVSSSRPWSCARRSASSLASRSTPSGLRRGARTASKGIIEFCGIDGESVWLDGSRGRT